MLYLTKEQADELVIHLKQEYPCEGCGILAGKDGLVEEVYLMVNADKSEESYFMDPVQQLKVMKQIRNSGREMMAIYHSHPETDAYPSAHDIELALYPDVSYIIVSLKKKDDPVIRSFKITQGRIKEEEVKIQ